MNKKKLTSLLLAIGVGNVIPIICGVISFAWFYSNTRTNDQNVDGSVGLRLEVVRIDAAGKLDFLHLDGLLLLLGFLFLLVDFITVFAVIHRTADGGLRGRGDQDQIESPFVRIGLRVVQAHDAELPVVLVDHPHLSCPDVVIDNQFFRANC